MGSLAHDGNSTHPHVVGTTRVLPLDNGGLVGRLYDLGCICRLMNYMGLVVCRLNNVGLANVVRCHMPSMRIMIVIRFCNIL